MKSLNLSPDAPWRARYQSAKIFYAFESKLNPDRGLACTNQSGIMQLYAWDREAGELRQLSNKPKGLLLGSLSASGDYLYYLDDDDGNEIGHYVRVPFEGGEPEDITPDLPPYASFSINENEAGTYLGFMVADQDGFTACVIERDGKSLSKPRKIWHSRALAQAIHISFDGEIAVINTTEASGHNLYNLVAVDVASGEKIGTLHDEGSSTQMSGFSPLDGDDRYLASSNQTGFARPLVWNPKTGERLDIDRPEWRGDVRAWGWSKDGREILLGELNRAQFQLYVYNLASQELRTLGHPKGSIGGFFGGQFLANGNILINWQDAVNPPCMIEIDAESGQLVDTVLTAGPVPSSTAWRSVEIPSNGVMVQGWLATPEGDGPFPTIFHTHGGPTAVQTETYMPESQAWLDHGFAFFTLNYRGSITFGRDFESVIWGNLGVAEVEDMEAARSYLVDNGIADPDAILLTGGSYGGYLTLMGLGKQPSLWAGGMAGVAVADWNLMYEDMAETLRGYARALLGGTPEEQPEAYLSSSPSTYVEHVAAPLLVIQGRNDTRCPARQFEYYEEKMRAADKHIEVEWFDAGHGSREVDQQISHQELKMRFAYRVLG